MSTNNNSILFVGRPRAFFISIFFAVIFIFGGAHTALAAVRTSTATGGDWSTGSTWIGGVAPGNTDSVIIATTGGNSVTLGTAKTNAGLTVQAGAILNFLGAYVLTENGNVDVDGSIIGSSGTIRMNAAGLTINGSGSIGSIVLANQSFSFLSSANLTVNNNINSAGRTVTNNGIVTLTGNYARTGGTAVWTQGVNAVLNIGGVFTPSANVTLNASASGNTINYNAVAQAIEPATYYNLILDGSGGVKTISSGTAVSGNLSIAPTGTATASIGAGLNISVGTLTLGGLGRINGTWGSTSSSATYKNDTYFALTTGRLTVTTDTRTTPTISVTNSPVNYTGSGQAATVTGSVDGTASNILTGGSATQTNAGTYAVTANFTPTDGTSYKSLTAAAAGNFTINPISQTITFNALSDKTLGTPDFTVSATASSGLTVSFSSLTIGVCTVNTATVHLLTMGTCTIRASQSGSGNYGAAPDVDRSFSVAAGPAAVFLLNNPGDVFAKVRLGYTVSRQDASGNPTGTGTTTVYLNTSSVSSTAKFYNDSLAGSVITSIDIAPGHSTANFWYYDETPGTYTITAYDNILGPDGATGIVDATDAVIVMPVATKFVILPPTSGTVDAPITVTVQAQKPDNSIDTNYQQDVTLHATGSATASGNWVVDIINGVGTKNISDTVAESVNLSLIDSQGTGLDVSSTQSVTFAGGAIAQFTLSHPATLSAGTRAPYTITRKDQYGNPSALATSTVYLYSSSTGANKKFYDAADAGSVITSVQIPDGQTSAQVWYYDELPGTWSIVASDAAGAPDYNVGINDAVDTLSVVAGPVAQFSLAHTGDMTAGTRLEFTVTRKDQFNNLVTSGATTVHLSSDSIGALFYSVSSGGTALTSLSIGSGQSSALFWYFDPNTGVANVTASDSVPADGALGIIDATDPVTVNAAPIHATRFVIDSPLSGTVDASIPITVRAEDAAGNVDSTYQSDVTLNSNGSVVGLVDISNGVGTISLSSTVAETKNLTLTDSQTTGLDVSSTRSVVFAPGAVAQLSLNNPGDVAAGMRVGYTVSRKDQYGNVVTSGATTVTLSSSSTGVNKKFFDAETGGSAITQVAIEDGLSSVGFWAYDEKAGNWLITVSAAGTPGANDPILVQPAAISKFILNNPGNMTAGTRLGYTVTREDRFDNLVTSGVTLAYFYSSSTATTTAFYTADTGGATTLFATINDGSSSGSVWYYDQTPGTWLVTVSDSTPTANGAAGVADASDSVVVSAVPIVATRFVILPVTDVQVGTPATVTVEAQDAAGNIDTTYQTGVMLHTTGSATGAGLVMLVNGVGTLTLSDTVAETIALSLTDSQSTGLNVSSTRSLTFSAVPVAPVVSAGGGGGAAVPMQTVTGVQLSGLAPAGSTVQVLAVSPAGSTLQGQAIANAAGSFYLLLKQIAVGVSSYGVVGIDALGRTTQTKVFNANYTNPNDFLRFDGMLLSPTLGLVHSTVRRNDVVGFVGSAVPGYDVGVVIDGKKASFTTAADDGSYKILFPTAGLSLGSHTASVRQVSPSGRQSDYAPQKVFTVTTLFTPQTDFNQDGVINVQDWSIFLSQWSSANRATRMLDDLNGDGKVDVSDLSIFVRTLKK